MQRTNRRDDADPARPADGPLTRLLDDQERSPEQRPAESGLPQPPEASRDGRDDYAGGTSEHDDDRE